MMTTDLREQTRCIEDGAGVYFESNGVASFVSGASGY